MKLVAHTGFQKKSVGGNIFLKINKTGGDVINIESRMMTCRREKQPKKNKISSCFIRNSRKVGPGQGMSIHIYRYRKTIHTY